MNKPRNVEQMFVQKQKDHILICYRNGCNECHINSIFYRSISVQLWKDSRMKYVVVFALISLVAADPKYVVRKLCKDVDASQCTVRSVILDPCDQGIGGKGFCTLKKNKNYAVTLDLVPRFSATKLKVSVLADTDNSGNYTTEVKTPSDACSLLYCPLQSQERRIFDVYMSLDKRASGKFPVAVKLWNEENESEACCVSFTVKVK